MVEPGEIDLWIVAGDILGRVQSGSRIEWIEFAACGWANKFDSIAHFWGIRTPFVPTPAVL